MGEAVRYKKNGMHKPSSGESGDISPWAAIPIIIVCITIIALVIYYYNMNCPN